MAPWANWAVRDRPFLPHGSLKPVTTGNDSRPLDGLFPSLVEPVLQVLYKPVRARRVITVHQHGLRQVQGRCRVGDDDDAGCQEDEVLGDQPDSDRRFILEGQSPVDQVQLFRLGARLRGKIGQAGGNEIAQLMFLNTRLLQQLPEGSRVFRNINCAIS